MSDVQLLVVTSPNCTHCHRFLVFWEKERENWEGVTMREVSVLTEEGQQLARDHGIFASPGIILGGELLFSGGYDEEELRAKLALLTKADVGNLH